MFTLLAVVVSACSGGSGHASPATSTTLGPNPDVVPQVITPDYVNAVFKVLNHLDGNVTRSLVADGSVTTQDYAILRAIYNDPLYQEEVNIAQQSLQQNLANVRRPPGDRATTVIEVIDSSPTCVFVKTLSDYSRVVIHQTPTAASEYWVLKSKVTINDPSGLNPTAWSLSFNATSPTPVSIPDQCAA